MPSLPSLPSLATNTSYLSPIDSSSFESEKKIKFTPDFDTSQPTFWRIFKELANANNELVSYYSLQERLIAIGKLDTAGSVLMIEHMEKTGKIEKTEQYNIYRIGRPA